MGEIQIYHFLLLGLPGSHVDLAGEGGGDQGLAVFGEAGDSAGQSHEETIRVVPVA